MSPTRYCPGCGGPVDEGEHTRCRARLSASDPPRFCPLCGHQLLVQVLPLGFSARCVRCGRNVAAFRT